MFIERPDLTAIETALKRSIVTALLGPRQCGKTTLARLIARQTQANFFDLESEKDRARLQHSALALESLEGLVVIDEIQRQPEVRVAESLSRPFPRISAS